VRRGLVEIPKDEDESAKEAEEEEEEASIENQDEDNSKGTLSISENGLSSSCVLKGGLQSSGEEYVVPDLHQAVKKEQAEFINNNYCKKYARRERRIGGRTSVQSEDQSLSLRHVEPKCDKGAALLSEKEPVDDAFLDQLSEGCQRAVLNLEFLLGPQQGIRPFLEEREARKLMRNPLRMLRRRRRRRLRRRQRMISVVTNVSDRKGGSGGAGGGSDSNAGGDGTGGDKAKIEKVPLGLRSAKMKGLKNLLCSEKLNASAIQLQLTAQSQTDVGRSTVGSEDSSVATRPKRARRE